MTPNQTVAVNMRGFRKVRGWKQEELAAKLGWSKSVVSTAERSVAAKRNRQFTVDDLVLIAEAFGVAPADLLAPVLPCATCQGSPPAGFACQECGAAGELRDLPAADQAIRSEPRRDERHRGTDAR